MVKVMTMETEMATVMAKAMGTVTGTMGMATETETN